jgi:regulator of protease activity HflC (stomatin/prohibitin superfamily)
MAGIIIFLILAVVALAVAKFLKVEVPNQTRNRYGSLEHDGTTRANRLPNRIAYGAAGVFGALTLLFLGLSTLYTQTTGEASVIKSFTGQIVGYNANSGLATKAPWDDRITYDILNQQAIFSNPNNVHDDQKDNVKGGEISITDSEGVSANVDVAVRYSIRPDKVIDTFIHYGDQKQFEGKLVTQDLRSVVREAPAAFNTLEVLTKRSQVEAKIVEQLKARWEKEGVQVESVALQDIRYPDSTRQKFTDAQNAQTQKTIATAELETTKISAQQKVVQAQADAEANRVLNASLTPEILQIRAQDALKDVASHGNTIMTDGSTLLNLALPTKK